MLFRSLPYRRWCVGCSECCYPGFDLDGLDRAERPVAECREDVVPHVGLVAGAGGGAAVDAGRFPLRSPFPVWGFGERRVGESAADRKSVA